MATTEFEGARTIVLTHAVFRNLPPALFRRAEDGLPAMVVSLGAEDAVLPLGALRREFGIAEDSEDGRMLALIEQALEYVAGLRPGEVLPPEVLGGGMGFEPGPEHQRRAVLRVRVALGSAGEVGAGMSARAVALAITELAAVECLRGTLIEPVGSFRERTAALAHAHPGESHRALAAREVARLARVAEMRLALRFDELNAVDPDALLRTPDAVLPAMQAGRDVLHRSRLAWTPMLDAWDRAAADDWKLVERTYRFLAPRYMTATEWRDRFADGPGGGERAMARMIW